MTIYQLQYWRHTLYDDGLTITSGNCYTTKEEAEKAKEFAESIPADPYDLDDVKVKIAEVQVDEKFYPWIPADVLERRRAEIEEFYKESIDFDPYDDPAM